MLLCYCVIHFTLVTLHFTHQLLMKLQSVYVSEQDVTQQEQAQNY